MSGGKGGERLELSNEEIIKSEKEEIRAFLDFGVEVSRDELSKTIKNML